MIDQCIEVSKGQEMVPTYKREQATYWLTPRSQNNAPCFVEFLVAIVTIVSRTPDSALRQWMYITSKVCVASQNLTAKWPN